jgi:hypothetical protein
MSRRRYLGINSLRASPGRVFCTPRLHPQRPLIRPIRRRDFLGGPASRIRNPVTSLVEPVRGRRSSREKELPRSLLEQGGGLPVRETGCSELAVGVVAGEDEQEVERPLSGEADA